MVCKGNILVIFGWDRAAKDRVSMELKNSRFASFDCIAIEKSLIYSDNLVLTNGIIAKSGWDCHLKVGKRRNRKMLRWQDYTCISSGCVIYCRLIVSGMPVHIAFHEPTNLIYPIVQSYTESLYKRGFAGFLQVYKVVNPAADTKLAGMEFRVRGTIYV